MKWLLILASLAKPLFLGANSPARNPIDDFKVFVTQNAVKAVLVLAAVISLSIVFAAGIVIIALDIGAQLDQTGTLFLSSILSAGVALCAISLLVAAIVLNSVKTKNDKVPVKPLQTVGTDHPVQDAIALLIADFVKERELKRSSNQEYYAKMANYNNSSDKISSFRH